MNVLKVNDIHFFFMSTRAYKSIGKQGFINISELKSYNMRNKDIPILPCYHLTKSQKTSNYRVIRTLNALSNHIRARKTMKTFKSKLKENLFL